MKSTELTAKPHYQILDGLRGVAAVMVVWLHIFEAHSTSPLDQIINHGYLAVDFFFVLSGFVIGYAYDDRWHKISIADFFKRRLVRLHPMVIMGSIIGAIGFYFQGGALWPLINSIPLWKMLLVMLIGFTMFPLPPSMDIRGWYESYPLKWTCVDPILRIHCQHSLRCGDKKIFKDSTSSPRFPCRLCTYASCSDSGRRRSHWWLVT